MDIRLPLGLLFSAIGMLLTVFGLVTDDRTYQRSLGINVNLWWGLVILLFGASFVFRSRRSAVSTTSREQASEP